MLLLHLFYIRSKAFQVPNIKKSNANKMPNMKRRDLTVEEMADAARLYAAWCSYKKRNKGATQHWLGAESGLGTQGAVGQYLRGVIPLNIVALTAICRVIGAHPQVISPRLTEIVSGVRGEGSDQESSAGGWSDMLSPAAKSTREQRLITAHRVSGPDGKAALDALADQLLLRADIRR